MVKTHDREVFYKYLRPRDAIRVLEQLAIGWPSPLRFNDPFDTQLTIRVGFADGELADAFEPEILRWIFGDDDVPESMHPLVGMVVRMVRPLRHIADAQEVVAAARPAMIEGLKKGASLLEKFNAEWREWLRRTRVLCLAGIQDDLLMWSHYADCHRGAVIELKCIPEKDTAPCAAHPVIYRPDIPVMGTADQWVRHILGEPVPELDRLFEVYAFTKSSHWAYEQEWRCLAESPDGAHDVAELVELNALFPEEISAVFLGCRISDEHRDEILRLVAARTPHAKVFQARQSETKFKLVFDPVA